MSKSVPMKVSYSGLQVQVLLTVGMAKLLLMWKYCSSLGYIQRGTYRKYYTVCVHKR